MTTFKEFLAHEQGQTDDTTLRAARPTYRIHAQPDGRETEDALVLLGLALPLYTLFAAESQVPGQVVCRGVGAAIVNALGTLQPGVPKEPDRILPADAAVGDGGRDQRRTGRRASATLLRIDAIGWFDGAGRAAAAPARRQEAVAGPDRRPCPTRPRGRSGEHAPSDAGPGLLFADRPGRSGGFATSPTRAVDLQARRVGTPWLIPQVFDRALPGLACRLCDGAGRGDGLDESLILESPKTTIADDAFFTKPAAGLYPRCPAFADAARPDEAAGSGV